ncbi:MAG: hypothetical protein CH104c_0478 [Candidatus Woesebacteria bacterium]|nr:MAG: hypothetical protein CH104c_0478 [Candidatus Woesebacteria bacterium]
MPAPFAVLRDADGRHPRGAQRRQRAGQYPFLSACRMLLWLVLLLVVF